MPRLLAIIAAILRALRSAAAHPHSGDAPSRLTRFVEFDQRVEKAVERHLTGLARRCRAAEQWAIDGALAAAAWSAHALDRHAPSPTTSPELALHHAHLLRVPHPLRAVLRTFRAPVTNAVDRAEVQFRSVWPHPRTARHAARTFLAAAALGSAGLTAAATVLTAGIPVEARPDPLLAAAPTPSTLAEETPPAELPAGDPVPPAVVAATPEPAPGPALGRSGVPTRRGALPVGKGMWLYVPASVEGGDPVAIINRAKAVGLTHLYVRTGSTRDGFYAQDFLNALLPVAHANGVRVLGWDFPHLSAPGDDVQRAWAAITYKTPDGHRIDGFAADIETPSEGTNNNPDHARAYGEWLRSAVGDAYPLIAVVPRPSTPVLARRYPYAEVVASFDAIAPMVYWMDKDPGAEVANAIQYLNQFGKPVMPVGQAYDGGLDGGPGGRPSPAAILRFMQVSWQLGAPAASFWSWQHADQPTWDTIRDAVEFRLAAQPPASLNPSLIKAYQVLLTSLGFGMPATGAWDPATDLAVRAYQREARLPETGIVDAVTLNALLTPFKPPLPPGVDPSP